MKENVRTYLENTPAHRKKTLAAIHRLILKFFPKAEVSMKYKMPTYEWLDGWVALANQKNYISLYTCGPQHLEVFKNKHPKIKTGKGCINFRDKDEIPFSTLEDVIISAITTPKH